MKKRLIVVGGGAAGFFCAINAAMLTPDLEVLILERSAKILSKVRVSGGGRCNVTHGCFSIAEMIKNYPRGSKFVKKGFYHFFTRETIKWFLDRRIELHTEKDGRMFPISNSSETIINCFVEEAKRRGVQIMQNRRVVDITFSLNPGTSTSSRSTRQQVEKVMVSLSNGELLHADFICIACGGFQTMSQFEWLRSLNHTIVPPVPSLFTFNLPKDPIHSLMGVSVNNANVKIAGTKFSQDGPLLITHWGLSGPAILKLSSFAAVELARVNYHFKIIVNWFPGSNENLLRIQLGRIRDQLATQKIINRNPFHLPQSLWGFLLLQAGIHDDMKWGELPAKLQNVLAKYISSHEMEVKGKTTFKEEFVTAGGIDTDEIDPETMQSKRYAKVYFAGEVMNVDGVTGGFNFQHAWTSGYLAARAISQEILASYY